MCAEELLRDYIEGGNPVGFDMIWMDGVFICAMEYLEDGKEEDLGKKSIVSTCRKNGWQLLPRGSSGKVEHIVAKDASGTLHNFLIVWVRWLPRFEAIPVYCDHISELLF